MSRDTVTTWLEVAGIALIATGAFAWDWRFGVIVVGVLLMLLSYVIEAWGEK